MKRYCICPIIGDGTFDNSYRAAAADLASVTVNSIIPTDPNGVPVHDFAFCIIGCIGLQALNPLTNTFVFPDYPLDGTMDGMEAEVASGMKQSVEAYNLDGNGFHLDADYSPSDSYRELVNRILQQIEPAADVNRFDVSEPQT